MRAAIYSRKSKFTGKGESIENQITFCKEEGIRQGINDFLIYTDEGYSGKDTERPQFKQMMVDAENKKFDVIISYKLDRISRNTADFFMLIEKLKDININYISVKERIFDTTTPMGKVIMGMSAVLAQFERETIAERVKDNMYELAKTGRWLGGFTPYGFTSENIKYYDEEMNERSMSRLNFNQAEIEIVKLIYRMYLDQNSLYKVKIYLIEHGINARYKEFWSNSSLSRIIKNPVYATATPEIYEYLTSQGVTCAGNFNSKNGLLAFNRTSYKGKKLIKNDISDWICAVAKHDGIIDGKDWIKAQKQLSSNKVSRRQGKTEKTFISGIIRCAKCGRVMVLGFGNKRKDGTRNLYFKCSLKSETGRIGCNNKNIRVDIAEKYVLEKLSAISNDKKMLKNVLSGIQETAATSDIDNRITELQKNISKNELAINNLVQRMSLVNSNAVNFIVNEIDRLTTINQNCSNELDKLRNSKLDSELKNVNAEVWMQNLIDFNKSFKLCKTNLERREAISKIVERIDWDGANLKIVLIQT